MNNEPNERERELAKDLAVNDKIVYYEEDDDEIRGYVSAEKLACALAEYRASLAAPSDRAAAREAFALATARDIEGDEEAAVDEIVSVIAAARGNRAELEALIVKARKYLNRFAGHYAPLEWWHEVRDWESEAAALVEEVESGEQKTTQAD
jgi:hypothetical protein